MSEYENGFTDIENNILINGDNNSKIGMEVTISSN